MFVVLSLTSCGLRNSKLVIQENPTGQWDHMSLLKVAKTGTSFDKDGYFDDYEEMPYFFSIGDLYVRYRGDLEFSSTKQDVFTAYYNDKSLIKVYRLQDDKKQDSYDNMIEPLQYFDRFIAEDFGFARLKYEYEMTEPKVNDTSLYIMKTVGKLAFYKDEEMTAVGDQYTYVLFAIQDFNDSNVYLILGLDGTGFDSDFDDLTEIVDAMGMGVCKNEPVRPERVSESEDFE